MPWVTINGEQKKVACGPCIRGHRSTSCNHKDRLLLEVRKPGRPLSSCPHLGGNCGCERLVINYTIPRSSECACPTASSAAPVAEPVVTTAAGINGAAAGGRVQKTKNRKSVSSRNPAVLEKAIKATEDDNQAPKSCCSKNSTPPAADAADSATPPGEEKPTPSPDSSDRPLNVQLEARKEINFTPVTQVNGWNHTNLKTSGSTTVTQVQPSRQSSCCGTKAETPAPLPVSRAPAPQERNGYTMSNPIGQPHYEPNQSYPFFPGRAHPNERFQGPAFSTVTVPGVLGYGTNGNGFANFRPNYAQWTPGLVQGQVSNDFLHECTCGDACACLGCPVHPRNETTMKHVREITDFMVNDPLYSNPPSYSDQRVQYQPVYSDHSRTNGHHANARPAMDQNLFQTLPSDFANSGPSTPYTQDLNGSALWQSAQQRPAVQAQPPSELQHYGFPDHRRLSQYNSSSFSFSSSSHHDSPVPPPPTRTTTTTTSTSADLATSSTAAASDTPVLSPSSFYWQQLELPQCSDFTGACRCGDGCQCVGCLTHGGHDGVALSLGQAAAATVDDGFPQPKMSPKLSSTLHNGHGHGHSGPIDLELSQGRSGHGGG
ncbi:hypothetical protein IWZ01DRAFT_310077 [Phyllosticta capitalensis]